MQILTHKIRSDQKLQFLVLSLLSWILFFNSSWEFRPSMDAMTYGALAKHILTTGDWAHLHYSHQVYSDFYQHPPLVMWMTAWVFKVFGISDLTQKLLPNGFAFLSVLGVAAWGYRWRDSWWGFIAGLVLLTSLRFIKYSSGLLLDPFLAAFMLWSVFLGKLASEENPKSKIGLSYFAALGSGFLLAAAFMSKGLSSLVGLPVVTALLLSNLHRTPLKTLQQIA